MINIPTYGQSLTGDIWPEEESWTEELKIPSCPDADTCVLINQFLNEKLMDLISRAESLCKSLTVLKNELIALQENGNK